MRKRQRVSSADVAAQAGVSRATVSYVLNDRVGVTIPDETRRKVKEAARQLNYQPNVAAQALATGRMRVVALWVPTYHPGVFYQYIRESERCAWPTPYEQMVCPMSSLSGERARRAVVTRWPVDGILACDGGDHVVAALTARGAGAYPAIVNIGAYPTPRADDSVTVDMRAGAGAATRHLLSTGRNRVAYLVSGWGDRPDDPRYAGYIGAMGAAGREPEVIAAPHATAEDALATVTGYVNERGCPEAIFCFSDDMALGAYRALHRLGLRVPDDAALIGCDGLPELEYLEVPISTVAQPVARLCELGWQFLAERMEGYTGERRALSVEPTLVLRESSAS